MALYKLFFSFLSPAKIQEKIKIFFYKNQGKISLSTNTMKII